MTILNPFVSQEIVEHGMDDPTIPVVMQPSYAQAYEDVILDGLIQALLTKKKLYI